jgi:hypothetical protein
LALVALAPVGRADDEEGRRAKRYCSDTARAMFRACGAEAQDDYWNAVAKCINETDEDERETCSAEASEGREEALEECKGVRTARRDACARLGEARYDPALDQSMFKQDYGSAAGLNPYFPLVIGGHWAYAGGGETSTVDVLNETKLIDGVRCVVVRDTVLENGRLKEDTDDWFAEATDGTVWYFGEEVKDYETFDGDEPALPELISIDGSFKAGRDRDKAGVLFPGTPEVGQLLREEFSLGNAEDVSEVLSTTYAHGADPTLDQLVPVALVTALCRGDCVVTKNTNLQEPGEFAFKYYAPGLGFFLEVNPGSGDVLRLVGCNVDPRCATLP